MAYSIDLSGRVAFVTGASSGLGAQFAKTLARAGAAVVLASRDTDRLKELRARIEGEGGDAHVVELDVTRLDSIRAAVARAETEVGPIDILVNNAGIQLRKPMVELTTPEWRKVIDTNLTSAFVVGREAAKRMIASGHGKIINIGSLTSELARATVAPYTVAKGGIKMLTRAMAAEWAAHGIQANAIGPGYMLTDMNQALVEDPTFDAWVKSRAPAKRWGRPEELIGTAVFLASSASDYVNGQIIYVDGGMLAVL